MLYVLMVKFPDGRVWDCSHPMSHDLAQRMANESNELVKATKTPVTYYITPVLDI